MKALYFIFSFILVYQLSAQSSQDSLTSNPNSIKNQKLLLASTISLYSVGSVGLYYSWYKDFDQREFQFFNDWNEWQNMDKFGHIQASYLQADLLYNGFKWSGMSEDKAIQSGVLISLGFQTAIEIMDGFSEGWGFSSYDYMSNIIGVGSFAIQQKLWSQQRLKFKVSYWPENHSKDIIINGSNGSSQSLNDRSDILFGKPFYQKFLKDYNGQTIWLSFNPNSFIKNDFWPKWLNIAFGYGANNLYGGFSNQWINNGEVYAITSEGLGRQQQYLISLDYNLVAFKTKSKTANTFFRLMDYFKWPAPAIEYNSQLGWQFHIVFTN